MRNEATMNQPHIFLSDRTIHGFSLSFIAERARSSTCGYSITVKHCTVLEQKNAISLVW